MDLQNFFLKQKKAVDRGTMEVLAQIPAAEIGWRPAEGMLSLGEIARHLWTSEEALRRVALEGKWEAFEKRVEQGLVAYLGEVRSLPDELGEIERVHQKTLDDVEAFPLERWEELRENPKLGMRRKISVLLFGIIEHEIHHRAQVGAYLHILTGRRASPYAV